MASQQTTLSPMRTFPPAKLAIYYGWPSLVNGTGSPEAAARVFATYSHVVFGWGLQDSHHGDHAKTASIIAALQGQTTFYGYIPLGEATGLSPRKIKGAAKLWRKLAVAGVLLDEAGYDFGNTRKRQNQALDVIHAQGLKVIANAWRPGDLLSTFPGPQNPKGTAIALGPGDILLYESYRIRDGAPEDDTAWRDKIADLASRPPGTELWGIATGQTFDPRDLHYLVYCGILDGLDAIGWGEPAFSATDNVLPERPWPELPKATEIRHEGDVISNLSTYLRPTSLGNVEVDLKKDPPGRFLP
ncbi:MAG: hypothetical protein KAI47_28230 [Deltaproteobacteria bacterium]|nr:hypothetical protein [Deltaproteobacteria bacterium]